SRRDSRPGAAPPLAQGRRSPARAQAALRRRAPARRPARPARARVRSPGWRCGPTRDARRARVGRGSDHRAPAVSRAGFARRRPPVTLPGKMIPVKHIDHVAIAVSDIDQALAQFESVLGLRPRSREVVADQKTEAALLAVGDSDAQIELITPRGNAGLEKFLSK